MGAPGARPPRVCGNARVRASRAASGAPRERPVRRRWAQARNLGEKLQPCGPARRPRRPQLVSRQLIPIPCATSVYSLISALGGIQMGTGPAVPPEEVAGK